MRKQIRHRIARPIVSAALAACFAVGASSVAAAQQFGHGGHGGGGGGGEHGFHGGGGGSGEHGFHGGGGPERTGGFGGGPGAATRTSTGPHDSPGIPASRNAVPGATTDSTARGEVMPAGAIRVATPDGPSTGAGRVKVRAGMAASGVGTVVGTAAGMVAGAGALPGVGAAVGPGVALCSPAARSPWRSRHRCSSHRCRYMSRRRRSWRPSRSQFRHRPRRPSSR